MPKKIKKILSQFFFFSFVFFFLAETAFAALSCTVSASCSGGIVVLRIASTSNSHSELPSQSNYANLLCCSGVTGLSNSCSGTYAVALRLAGATNAHVEENTQSTAAYNGNDACLSVPSGGTVSIGYQDNNCNTFDTTLASISQTPTNAHIGDANAYTRKVCGSASSSTPVSTTASGTGGAPRFFGAGKGKDNL